MHFTTAISVAILSFSAITLAAPVENAVASPAAQKADCSFAERIRGNCDDDDDTPAKPKQQPSPWGSYPNPLTPRPGQGQANPYTQAAPQPYAGANPFQQGRPPYTGATSAQQGQPPNTGASPFGAANPFAGLNPFAKGQGQTGQQPPYAGAPANPFQLGQAKQPTNPFAGSAPTQQGQGQAPPPFAASGAQAAALESQAAAPTPAASGASSWCERPDPSRRPASCTPAPVAAPPAAPAPGFGAAPVGYAPQGNPAGNPATSWFPKGFGAAGSTPQGYPSGNPASSWFPKGFGAAGSASKDNPAASYSPKGFGAGTDEPQDEGAAWPFGGKQPKASKGGKEDDGEEDDE